jgi:hypothetical protein
MLQRKTKGRSHAVVLTSVCNTSVDSSPLLWDETFTLSSIGIKRVQPALHWIGRRTLENIHNTWIIIEDEGGEKNERVGICGSSTWDFEMQREFWIFSVWFYEVVVLLYLFTSLNLVEIKMMVLLFCWFNIWYLLPCSCSCSYIQRENEVVVLEQNKQG